MGDAVMWIVLGLVLAVVLVWKGASVLWQKLSTEKVSWPGDIVAAIVTYAQNPELGGDLTPQSAELVIRRRQDGLELRSFVGGAESLPYSVKRQVFAAGLVLKDHRATGVGEQEDGPHFRSVAGGGYRYNLDTWVPVHVEENSRGGLNWTPLD
ncbi:MAG: hypothetical protein ACTHXA_06430 [Gulosibacter sp.]|uniref:hypothetical protein n=1 Tax=Gulosibacter sp. TaxID=2817531 RepID=UPI003F903F5B